MAESKEARSKRYEAIVAESEAEYNQAAAKKELAEARKFKAEAETAEIQTRKLRRAEKTELAKDQYFHIYVFDKPVASSSVDACIQKLAEWSRTDPGCEIEIVLNSPGGSVVDGMALFDYIERIKREGHTINTSALGMAASMAGILLQAGHTRKIGNQAWLLIHEGQFGVGGSVGEVEDTVEWVKKMQERILDIFAARSNMSKAQIKRRWHRRDWWMSADEALKHGFVDEIG